MRKLALILITTFVSISFGQNAWFTADSVTIKGVGTITPSGGNQPPQYFLFIDSSVTFGGKTLTALTGFTPTILSNSYRGMSIWIPNQEMLTQILSAQARGVRLRNIQVSSGNSAHTFAGAQNNTNTLALWWVVTQ